MRDVKDELDPPFDAIEPAEWRGPVVFKSPHSGCVYPRAFLRASRLQLATPRRSEDCFVDELVIGVVKRGFPLLRAHFPRCYVDVNREPYELDPRMFEGRLPSFANTRSMRVAGGLGTIPRIVADGQDIYRGHLNADEALRRIEWLYKPYHQTLRHLVHRTAREFGFAVLIDCHSMPSTSLNRDDGAKADVVLGDRYGTSCASLLADLVEVTLRSRGYTVVRNKPYAGGSSPSTTAIPAPDTTPCRSRSTGPSTWMSARSPGNRVSRPWPPTWSRRSGRSCGRSAAI